MGHIWTMAQKELGAYFLSPIAYAVAAVYLFATGLAFGLGTFTNGGESSLRPLFEPWMLIILVFVLPMLTMRLLSEELRSGTMESLMTAPITETQIVLGKFVGAFIFYAILLASLFIYPVLIEAFGSLDLKLLLCNLVGLLLLGALYLSVGLFFSACTRHQIVAVLLSLAVLVIATFAVEFLAQKVEGWPRAVLQQLSISSHFRDFVRGLLDVNHLVFFVTLSGLFLFLTVKRVEMRRWQ